MYPAGVRQVSLICDFFGMVLNSTSLVHLILINLGIGKDSDAGRDCGQEEKGTTEDEMAGWHH